MTQKATLDNIRHSAAHVLAQAVLELFPGTKLTIGPTTATGFFYDFLPLQNFKETYLPHIEEKMREIVDLDLHITGAQVPKDQAREQFKDNKSKLELIDGIENRRLSTRPLSTKKWAHGLRCTLVVRTRWRHVPSSE